MVSFSATKLAPTYIGGVYKVRNMGAYAAGNLSAYDGVLKSLKKFLCL